ncbi:hypothetical protein CAEBREN_09199 [Caenorhabditis brenneri]|uniref:Uncharacterized protein n=1 Tax=Caenorhabditis brenneri TaxID=135651 RepID=G0M949_CAEBE|nr:hypothetical protein CAEBREN_09199 [Caenorhabditis brenneri]
MEDDPRQKILREKHQREKQELQQKFEAEQRKTQTELENVIKEGQRKIGRLENEKKETEQKREIELRKYEDEMKKMADEYKSAMEQHKTTETDLKKQLIDQKKSQMQKEHQFFAQLLNKQVAELEKERERTSTVAVLKHFLTIMQTSHEAMESLSMVKIYCIESSPASHQAHINFELDNLRGLREKFRDQYQKFPQFLLNEPKANRNTVESCRHCITQVDQHINDDMIRELCGLLPSALENGNQLRIKNCGRDAKFLASELKLIEEKKSKLLTEYGRLANLPAIGSSQNLSISN